MKKKILFLLCVLSVLLLLTACGKITVNWVDADGSLLYTEEIKEDETVAERALPENSDEWQYTGWGVSGEGTKNVTYTAERIAKTKITWLDVDGNVLNTASICPGDSVPVYGLPMDTDEWQYTKWKEVSSDDTEIVFQAERVAKIRVIWQDYNGVVLHQKILLQSADIPERSLPEDVDGWHYTGWKQMKSGEDQILLKAERVAVKTVIWKDADGKVLAKEWVSLNAALPTRALPTNDVKWVYNEWTLKQSGNVYTYTAKGEPNSSYFAGNVFQLVAQNLGEGPIALGSGFVLNKQGWFITNYHVLEDACTASAIFEIKEPSTGKSYTKLSISQISYYDKDKDILIGKIDNYSKIASYYKSISLNTQYEVGDVTYSVGYPGGTTKVAVNKGEVLKDVSTIWDKLYGGNDYIASSSYITNGSSGGILINDKMEVIGITAKAIEEDGAFLGSSIKAYNFVLLISKYTKNTSLQNMACALHPELLDFIEFFQALESDPLNYKKIEDEAGFYYLSEDEFERAEDGYYNKFQFYVYHDGSMLYVSETHWGSGAVMVEAFGGVYTNEDDFDNFNYAMTYQYPSGAYFYLETTGKEYGSGLQYSLKNYSGYASYGSLTEGDISTGKRMLEGVCDFIVSRIKYARTVPRK